MGEVNKLNVLCVEDDLVVADYITSLLDESKYNVQAINDGQQALNYLLSTTHPPDIVILDYILPSLNGLQILQKLNDKGKSFAILFLTADETLETAVKAIKAGALDYLSKSNYMKGELNLKIEKAYQIFQERIRKDIIEGQLALRNMAIEQSPNSIVITDKDGMIEYVNPTFSLTTGYLPNEVKGQNLRILKSGVHTPEFYKTIWNTIAAGKTWNGEIINRRKNGDLFYEKTIISPIKNKYGQIINYFGIKEDITELKKAEQSLKEKTDEITHFFEVAVGLLCIMDSVTNKFTKVNQAWKDTLGYTENELIGKSYLEFIHPEDVKLTLDSTKELFQKGRTLNFVNRYCAKDGSYKFIEWNSILSADGAIFSSARDITERRQREQALKESEARFRTIFEMANSGIFFADRNGRIVLINKTMHNIIGYSLRELYHMDLNQYTHPDDVKVEDEMILGLIDGSQDKYRIEERYIGKSGKIIWVDLALSAIRNEKRELVYFVGVVNDISERKQYEYELKEQNNTINKFFSIIAHDLRSQLSGIQGLSGLLVVRKDTTSVEEKDRFLSMLHNSGKSALTLLENLLEWSRSQLNRMELVHEFLSLRTLVGDVIANVQNQSTLKQIKVLGNIPEAYSVYADKHMIETVLRNLVNNSIKFTPVGGLVMIDAYTEGKYDVISVKDDGVGMPQNLIDKLFKLDSNVKPSYGTAKEKGSGLGLILCREFIEKHGGEIKVQSKEGQGSEFFIFLPKYSEAPL